MKVFLAFAFFVLLVSCSKPERVLPYLGVPEMVHGDTVYPVIPDFQFEDQSGDTISQETFKGKVYVADFIFLSCPTICPVMTKELKKVYSVFSSDERVLFLSHTIDPEHDTRDRLWDYSSALEVDPKKWFFVRGEKELIYRIAEDAYFSSAFADSTAPGGFVHSGAFLLIDTRKHIRGVYDGTNPEETQRLIDDIHVLLQE
jgi:protein SCO1/2